MGRCPARSIPVSEARPRPVPARQRFCRIGRGPARPIEFQIISTRPGPAYPCLKFSARPGPAQDNRSKAHGVRAPYGLARGLEGPAHWPARVPAYVLPRTRSSRADVFQVFLNISNWVFQVFISGHSTTCSCVWPMRHTHPQRTRSAPSARKCPGRWVISQLVDHHLHLFLRRPHHHHRHLNCCCDTAPAITAAATPAPAVYTSFMRREKRQF